jgi:DHA2 family multidrug resistance protein-like MFS transporter
LSMSRMVGGTFGVAVLGAIFQGQSRASLDSALADTGIGADRIGVIAEQLGSGGLEATIAGLPAAQVEQATGAAREAFVSSLATSIGISGAVAAAGAVAAIFLISAKARDVCAEDVAPDVQPAAPALASDAAR